MMQMVPDDQGVERDRRKISGEITNGMGVDMALGQAMSGLAGP